MKKILLIILIAILGLAVVFLFKLQSFYNQINTKTSVLNILNKPKEKTEYNILLLGYGGGTHEGAYLTDTIMIVHIDTTNKKIVLLSLPRDIWVRLPTKSGSPFHTKINNAYEIGLFPADYPDVRVNRNEQGAAELTKTVVGELTGIPIDYYVAVDFQGFTKAVDLLGGVDINVEKTFDDYEYPIEGKENDLCGREDDFKKIEQYLTINKPTLTPDEQQQKEQLFKDKPELEKFFNDITSDPAQAFPCRYEHLHFDRGLQHMDGITALKYSRSRHSLQDGTDFGRAARQQRLIEAVKDKVFSVAFIPKILPMMDEMKNNIKTDLDLSLITRFNQAAKKNEDFSITSAVPDQTMLKSAYADNGQFILITSEGEDHWNLLHVWVKNVLEGITPAPSAAPSTGLKPTAK